MAGKLKAGTHQWRGPRINENSAVCELCGVIASDYHKPCVAPDTNVEEVPSGKSE